MRFQLPSLQTFLLKDVQRVYKWKASFMEPGLGEKDGEGATGFKKFLFDAVTDFAGSFSSEVREQRVLLNPFTIQSITVPSYDTEYIPVLARGTETKIPTKFTIGTLDMSFYETGDGEVTQTLNAWRKLIYNAKRGTFGLPNEYEADIMVQLTTSFGVVHTTFLMKNCWPATSEPLRLEHESGGQPLIIGQQFHLRRMEINTKGLLEVLTGGDLTDLNLPNITSPARMGGLIF